MLQWTLTMSIAGGMSFLSTQYGWAANSVINFEVVLANGTIVNANAKEHTGKNQSSPKPKPKEKKKKNQKKPEVKLTLSRSIRVSERRRQQLWSCHGIHDADTSARA